MRFRRTVEGRLGPVVDRDRAAAPARIGMRALIVVVLVCAAIFAAAFLWGVHHH